jgi:hypothetical protein
MKSKRFITLSLVFFWMNPAQVSAAEEITRKVQFSHKDEIVRGQGFAVIADRRIFAVTAFINATGYDEEADGREMHSVRRKVRAHISKTIADQPEKSTRWIEFYNRVDLPIFVYLDFALCLSGDYPFERIHPVDELGYPQTLNDLVQLPALLNEFWESADLASIWEEVKPEYLAELQKYDFEGMTGHMRDLWAYLRMPRKDTYTIVNVPNLLAQHYLAIGAEYQNYYYTVESPGAQSYSLNTHEYLHSIVNPIVEKHFDEFREKLTAFYESGRSGPYAKSYQHPVTYVYECLVRALDYRLRLRNAENEKVRASIESRVDELTAKGLSLTRPFYDALAQYEGEHQPFDRAVTGLFTSVIDATEKSAAGEGSSTKDQ